MQPSGCQLPSLESVSSSVQVTKFICYQAAWTSWFSYLIQALPFILKTEGGWQVWMRWFCTGGNCFLVICSPCLYFGSLCYLLQVKSTSLENNENMLIFYIVFWIHELLHLAWWIESWFLKAFVKTSVHIISHSLFFALGWNEKRTKLAIFYSKNCYRLYMKTCIKLCTMSLF